MGAGSDTRWEVLVAASRGATHEAMDAPLQDAIGFGGNPKVPGGVFAAAVADGHGHPRHFRSDRGAKLAVSVAIATSQEIATHIRSIGQGGGPQRRADIEKAVVTTLIPVIVERWVDEVAQDVAIRPFDALDRTQQAADDDATIAYGTTLLFVLVAVPWLVLCQIGDGDVVVVYERGGADTPLPRDPELDGWRTTSMCQRDAPSYFRSAVLDLQDDPVEAVLLATDGLGNAQVDDPWQASVARDLVRLAREHGTAWMRDQLAAWVARCASGEGSGDDAAAALLLREPLARPGSAS